MGIKNYFYLNNLIIRKQTLDRLPKIDTIIFDIDGVLIDVRLSFRKTICETVQFYFKQILHFEGKVDLVKLEEIEFFKLAGGFNNDWNLSLAIVLFYLIKAVKNNLKDTNELRNSKPDLKEFAEKILSRGEGLFGVKRIAEQEKKIREKVFNLWNKGLIIKIFKEIYAGEKYCFNLYGFQPSIIRAKGNIEKEKVILTNNKRDILRNLAIGILSGRTKEEAEIALKKIRWEDLISENHIITADYNFEKPNPACLKELSDRLHTRVGIYIGDTRDDLITVKNFNKGEKGKEFLSGIVSSGYNFNLKGNMEHLYLREGVDLLAPEVNEILDLLEKAKSDKLYNIKREANIERENR